MAKFSSKFNAKINKSVYKFIKTFAQLTHLAACWVQGVLWMLKGSEEGCLEGGFLTLPGVDF